MTVLGYVTGIPSTAAAQSAHTVSLNQPGYYRMQVGDFLVTALSDGTIPQDADQLLTHTGAGEVDRLLQLHDLPSPVETSVNAYLITTPDNQLIQTE